MFDRVQGGPDARPARVFGEMVDLLCRDGRPGTADELERLWNVLAKTRRFSLLCGYRLDIFDPQTQSEAMPDICREHSHVLPARNYPRFARAVDSALREVLGPNHAATVYVLVSREVGHDQIPLAQSILMWVSNNLPTAIRPDSRLGADALRPSRRLKPGQMLEQAEVADLSCCRAMGRVPAGPPSRRSPPFSGAGALQSSTPSLVPAQSQPA